MKRINALQIVLTAMVFVFLVSVFFPTNSLSVIYMADVKDWILRTCTLTSPTITGTVSFTGGLNLDDGDGDSPSLTFTDEQDETAVLTKVSGDYFKVTTAATRGIEVATGNLVVGDGTPDVTLDGEDAYVEGTFEVDDAARFDGTFLTTSTTTMGDATTDQVIFVGRVSSDLVPIATGTYDLGASGLEWEDAHITGTANIDSLIADTADINAGTWQGAIDGAWDATGQTCSDLGTVSTVDINAGTWQGTIDGPWTAASQDCADLGSVTTCDINGGTITGITDLAVEDGGTGKSALGDGGILLGSGAGAITAMAVLGDGEIAVGNGATDPVALAAFSSSTGDVLVAAGGTGVSTLTDHGVLVGSGTTAVTPLSVGSTNEVLRGSTGADPAFGSLVDADVPAVLTLVGSTIDNSIIGATTPAAITTTILTVNTSATFSDTDVSDIGVISVDEIRGDANAITIGDGADTITMNPTAEVTFSDKAVSNITILSVDEIRGDDGAITIGDGADTVTMNPTTEVSFSDKGASNLGIVSLDEIRGDNNAITVGDGADTITMNPTSETTFSDKAISDVSIISVDEIYGDGNAITVGDGSKDTVAIETTDWGISATGDATGIGAITADGVVNLTGTILDVDGDVRLNDGGNGTMGNDAFSSATSDTVTNTLVDAGSRVIITFRSAAVTGDRVDVNPGNFTVYVSGPTTSVTYDYFIFND